MIHRGAWGRGKRCPFTGPFTVRVSGNPIIDIIGININLNSSLSFKEQIWEG